MSEFNNSEMIKLEDHDIEARSDFRVNNIHLSLMDSNKIKSKGF